jgi:hypothetical protein
MSDKPNSKLLEQLGWVAVRWSGVELMVELTCAYLFHAKLVRISDPAPPRPFKSRVKFIRKGLAHPAFVHLRPDYDSALEAVLKLSGERNELMHGAITSWGADGSASQTVIKSSEDGYVALLDIVITEAMVSDLAERLKNAFAIQFNLHDRFKAVVRALQADAGIDRRAMMDE